MNLLFIKNNLVLSLMEFFIKKKKKLIKLQKYKI